MKAKVTMKAKVEGEWRGLPLAEFAGQTLEQVFLQLDGMEAIVEVDIDGRKAYITGTETWRDYYREKGRPAYAVSEAIERLRVSSPRLLDMRVEDPLGVVDLFAGSEVERVESEI